MATAAPERTVKAGWWESFYQGLTYRGYEGHWAWIFHRVTGLGVLLFLTLHIVDIFLLTLGPGVFNSLLALYKAPAARILDVFLLFGVLFHAVNGLRIVIIDFWPHATRAHKAIFWAEVAVFLIVFVPSALVLLAPLFGWGGGAQS
ncbi:MAG TPA: succinate dehydrogenase, cytochrome b556 subunit [Candidatus Fraserbacteria bacterium]|nr:succinate dehydrogenase, cytochrome b556 subunit [Candidatus Fraserbacteria bacterium]